ncbi:MAG TPA: hypothetical protein PLL10_07480, partial [Elusimicrobiales bacterium]|nr:hypothetical protein [Elusimicrobiales bacterium]
MMIQPFKRPLLLKAAIALGGLLAALVFLELGIRATGSAAKYLQNRRNAKALAAQGTIRVMCVGDSMTFSQYPQALEKLLNKNTYGLRFNVIDRGLPGTTSSDTLAALPNDLDVYKPHIVIAMIGENDKTPGRILLAQDFAPQNNWLRSLRIYRIWHYTAELLLKHK